MVAVITDVHYRMSLALIRDLAQAGVSLVVCEQMDREGRPLSPPLGFRSRYVKEKVLLPREDYQGALLELCRTVGVREGCRPALLPVGASTLAMLARPETRAAFQAVCGLCLPTQSQLDTFNDKSAVARLGEELGIPVPRNYGPEETPAFPCVVKPLCGEKFGLTAQQRYVIAADSSRLEEARARFSALTGEQPLVQQYLPGGGLGCSFLAREGEVLAWVCHRRLREYPVTGGPSTCCAAFHSAELEGYVRRLAAAVGYSGLAMVEFKEDAEGRPHLLEINPRIWGSFPLTRAAATGIPLLWFAQAWNAGNPSAPFTPPTPSPYPPRRMVFFPSDLMAGLGYCRRGQPGKALGALADFFNPAVRDGLFQWSDPAPALAYYRSLLGGRKKSGA